MYVRSRFFRISFQLILLGVLLALSHLEGAAQLPPLPPPSTLMPPVRTVSVYGQKIAYYDLSNGPALVLLHGLGTSATLDWGEVVRPLAARYRVIAIDQIGFGESDKPALAYNTQVFVDFLAEFLRGLGLSHVMLAGESMGGWVAAVYTIQANAPNSGMPTVDRLILSDAIGHKPAPDAPLWRSPRSAPSSPTEMREGLARGLFYNKELATEAFALDRWRLTTAYKSGDTVEAIRQSVLTEKQQYVDGRLNEIKVPTLVIWGRDDNLVPLSEGEDYHAKIVGSKFVVVPECGHAPPIEKPGVFVKAVFEFLGAAAQ